MSTEWHDVPLVDIKENQFGSVLGSNAITDALHFGDILRDITSRVGASKIINGPRALDLDVKSCIFSDHLLTLRDLSFGGKSWL
jgi:hypothetical protein